MNENLLQSLVDNIPVFLTGGFTILGAIGGGIISGRNARKNDRQRLLHEKRADLYSEFYEIVEKLWNDRLKIFDRKYWGEIISYKAKMKLLSSKRTYDAFKNFYKYVQSVLLQFDKYCSANNPYNNPDNFETFIDEDGDEITQPHVTKYDEEIFEAQTQKYMKDHIPTIAEIETHINPLYEAMRKDLGSIE